MQVYCSLTNCWLNVFIRFFFERELFFGDADGAFLSHDGEDQAEIRQVCYISLNNKRDFFAMLLMLYGQQQQHPSCYLTEKLFTLLARCCWQRLRRTSSKGRRWSTGSDSLVGFRSNVILSNDFQRIKNFFQNGYLTTNYENELVWYFLLHNWYWHDNL